MSDSKVKWPVLLCALSFLLLTLTHSAISLGLCAISDFEQVVPVFQGSVKGCCSVFWEVSRRPARVARQVLVSNPTSDGSLLLIHSDSSSAEWANSSNKQKQSVYLVCLPEVRDENDGETHLANTEVP